MSIIGGFLENFNDRLTTGQRQRPNQTPVPAAEHKETPTTHCTTAWIIRETLAELLPAAWQGHPAGISFTNLAAGTIANRLQHQDDETIWAAADAVARLELPEPMDGRR